MLLAGSVQNDKNVSEKPLYFTNHLEMVRVGLSSKFTNRFELSFGIKALETLPPNFSTNLIEELGGSAFWKWVTIEDQHSPKRVPEFRVLFCEEKDFIYVVFLADSEQDTAAYREFALCARYYMTARFDGHTTDYIRDAIAEHREATNSLLPLGFPLSLKQKYLIPSRWLEKPGSDNYWLVRDGRFAWLYWTDHRIGFFEKRDGMEYDPKTKAQFDDAKEEARRAVSQNGVSGHASKPLFEEELKRILKKKFQLDWITPEELQMSP